MYASVSNGPSEPGRKQTVPESARGTRCLGGHDEVCKTGNPGTHTHIQGTQSVWACCAEGTCTECVCVCVCHSDRPSSDAPRLHTSLSTGCVYVRVVKPEKDAFRAYGSVPKGSRGMIDGNKVVDWLAAMQSLRRTNW